MGLGRGGEAAREEEPAEREGRARARDGERERERGGGHPAQHPHPALFGTRRTEGGAAAGTVAPRGAAR
jgi:hypothetical protein